MGIFAHPDDDTFGPGGTFIKYASSGHRVHVLTATSGQAGQSAGLPIQITLGDTRKIEYQHAMEMMGITGSKILDFYDGTLNESQLPLLKQFIEHEVKTINPDVIIIYERGGISFHLDHIAVTKAVLTLFDEQKISPKKIYYFGLSNEMNTFFGREGYMDEKKKCSIDIEPFWQTKIKAMNAHKSQMNDIKRILGRFEDAKKAGNHFWKYEEFSLARTSLPRLMFPESDILSGI